MIDVDLVFFNFLFTINVVIVVVSLFFGLSKKVYVKPKQRIEPKKHVSIFVPLLREKTESIMTVARSLTRQSYPKVLFDVIFIIEPEDTFTKNNVLPVLKYLDSEAVRNRVIQSDGGVKLKAHALNCALKEVDSEVIAVYDADDAFPEDQVENALGLICEGCDVVSVRVSRRRNTVLGSFLHLDTYIWFNIFIPFIQTIAKINPFSGEGLFLRRGAIIEVGGFPEVLAEDAYLSIPMAEKNFKTALLDSEVEELAPKGVASTIRQRLRWNRGYLQCFGAIFKSHLSLRTKLSLTVAFLSPITCASSVITTILFILYWVTWAFTPGLSIVAPWMRTPIYTNLLFYWSAILAYMITAAWVYLIAYLIAGQKFERLAMYVIVLPVYWLFLGVISMASPFMSSKRWFKTERR